MYTLKESEKIFVFTGPHGAGRKTVAEMLGSTLTMKQVLSHTTRPQKSTEVHGQDYFFVTPAQFAELEAADEFIEVISIRNNRYGVRSSDIEKMFQSIGSVYLILNRHGAETLKNLYGDRVVRICIYAGIPQIEKRLREKGESEEMIQSYLSSYSDEMAYQSSCEFIVENVDLAHTAYALTKSLDAYLNRNLVDLD
jgi:guanylate kinase